MSNATRAFRALLWKDIRVNRLPLMVVLVLWLGSYALMLGAPRPEGPVEARERAAWAAAFSTGTLLLGVSLLAANLAAGERADRSAAFLAYLPPRRGLVLASKAVCGAAPCAVLLAVNAAVILAAWHYTRMSNTVGGALLINSLIVLWSTAPLVFGAAWLCGVLTRSPAIGATCGLIAPAVFALALTAVKRHMDFLGLDGPISVAAGYGAVAVATGVALFATGSAVFLRARPAV